MSTISSILPTPPDGFSTQIASASITTSSLSVELDDATGLPTEGVGQFFKKDANGDIVAGSIEFCHWTGKSSNTLTFSDTGDRGITGSDSGAQAYVADDYFEVWVSSYYLANDELDSVFNPTTGALDTAKVADLTTAQTLTNKTLTSPVINPISVSVQITDASTDATTGDGKAVLNIPSNLNGYNLNAVGATVTTAPVGSTISIQIHNATDTQDMLSTALTIDASETSSATAATPAVINTSFDDVATDDIIRIDVDQVGSSTAGAGLVVRMEFTK